MDALERLQKIDRSQEIDGWNVRIYFWSRSPRILALAAADKPDQAEKYYEREVKFFGTGAARAKLVMLVLDKKHDLGAARKLAADPAFASALTTEQTMAVAQKTHRWGDLIRPMAKIEK